MFTLDLTPPLWGSCIPSCSLAAVILLSGATALCAPRPEIRDRSLFILLELLKVLREVVGTLQSVVTTFSGRRSRP